MLGEGSHARLLTYKNGPGMFVVVIYSLGRQHLVFNLNFTAIIILIHVRNFNPK